MSSFLKEEINPITRKKQLAFCIEDFYGEHQYGYGFSKDGSDANFLLSSKIYLSGRKIEDICDFYKEEELKIKFDELTRELKDMESSDRSYGGVWNERAEISRQLNNLHYISNNTSTL